MQQSTLPDQIIEQVAVRMCYDMGLDPYFHVNVPSQALSPHPLLISNVTTLPSGDVLVPQWRLFYYDAVKQISARQLLNSMGIG